MFEFLGIYDMMVEWRLNSESESMVGGPDIRIFSFSLSSVK